MNTHKSIRAIAAAILVTRAIGASAADEKDQKSVMREETQRLSAKVESIDRANRKIVLAAADGRRETLEISPEVRNFDRIHEGDNVVVDYRASLAAQVKPSGTELKDVQAEVGSERAKVGEQPGGAVGAKLSATVQVESVDPKSNTITFKRADDSTGVVEVEDPKAQEFLRKLKKGDRVEVVYTEAVALSVEPAPAK